MNQLVKHFIIIIVLVFLDSCNCDNNNETVSFVDYYNYKVSIITDYESMWENNDTCVVCEHEWMYFLENCSYLEALTGCHFHFIDAEPPYYKTHDLYVKDSLFLSDWLNENQNKWTKYKADKYVYKNRHGHSVYF